MATIDDKFIPLSGITYKHDYNLIFKDIADGRIPKQNVVGTYRDLCKKDLFFLLYFGLERVDVNRPFIVDAIHEVEALHHNTLDLWAREHYKSTIITYALLLQFLIVDPEERICIFSHTRPIAKGFLRLIKNTLESQDVPLKKWFPDIFYKHPKRESPKWSEDDGLFVKRKGKYREASVEAWGMVDGQPTSKHFTKRIYDDVVTKESVTNVEQIKKVLAAWELSQSLGTDGGQKLLVGTHYHSADLYVHLKKKRKANGDAVYKTRVKPATHDGSAEGRPVLLSRERLEELREDQGPYVFSCQQLLNPIDKSEQKFRTEWLQYYDKKPDHIRKALLVDPANEKNKDSDYTTMGVIGADSLANRYLLDLLRDKLDLGERWKALFKMWRKWNPDIVGYEKYSMQADIAYHKEKQKETGVYFVIEPLGGTMSKADRIQRLVPKFESGQFLLPEKQIYYNNQNMVQLFIDEEYSVYPFVLHEDMLDMMARQYDEIISDALFVSAGIMTAEKAKELHRKHAPPLG